MQLLRSTVRRTAASRWICHSCRGMKHATDASREAGKPSPPSQASQQLREWGPARTRFAPSPTGFLHLGSLRTALFNYLVAKATGGQFLLRIEDTDQKRTIPGAEERLFKDLEWAGLEWDEGPKIGGPYGPYNQSHRTDLYREHAEQLLDSGNAYRCFCSPERLRTVAEYQSKLGLPADYDRTCTYIPKEESDDRAAKGEAHVIRLKSPDEKDTILFRDLVYGLIRPRNNLNKHQRVQKLAANLFDDPILLKSDGFPTYHLANVVDDHLMNITHVIRGSEWLSSTPKHLAIYQALGWGPPAFAHVGLLLDRDRQKLSKRTGSIDISEWRNKGVFPETLTNFLALLGWSHRAESDVMSMEDLIRNASMKYTRGDTVVGFEKLWFLQRRHAARYSSNQTPLSPPKNPSHSLVELAVKPTVALLDSRSALPEYSFYHNIPQGRPRQDFVAAIVWADAPNYTNPDDFIARNNFFFSSPSAELLISTVYALKLHGIPSSYPHTVSPETIIDLVRLITDVPAESWDLKSLKAVITAMVSRGVCMTLAKPVGNFGLETSEAKELAVKKGWIRLVHGYLRWALVAGNRGPDGLETMRVLGREETGRRLAIAGEILKAVEK